MSPYSIGNGPSRETYGLFFTLPYTLRKLTSGARHQLECPFTPCTQIEMYGQSHTILYRSDGSGNTIPGWTNILSPLRKDLEAAWASSKSISVQLCSLRACFADLFPLVSPGQSYTLPRLWYFAPVVLSCHSMIQMSRIFCLFGTL